MHRNDAQPKSIERAAEETAEVMVKVAESRPWLSLTAISGVIFGLVGLYDPIKDIYKQLTDPVYQGVASVQLADIQKQLWVKNSTCIASLVMQESVLSDDVTVRAGACPNRDVLVQIYPKNSPAISNWISLAAGNPTKAAGGLFPAMAASLSRSGEGAEPATIPVQMRISTVCQGWADPERKSKLIRVVNENGKCFKEITNVYSGRVEFREEVPCATQCK